MPENFREKKIVVFLSASQFFTSWTTASCRCTKTHTEQRARPIVSPTKKQNYVFAEYLSVDLSQSTCWFWELVNFVLKNNNCQLGWHSTCTPKSMPAEGTFSYRDELSKKAKPNVHCNAESIFVGLHVYLNQQNFTDSWWPAVLVMPVTPPVTVGCVRALVAINLLLAEGSWFCKCTQQHQNNSVISSMLAAPFWEPSVATVKRARVFHFDNSQKSDDNLVHFCYHVIFRAFWRAYYKYCFSFKNTCILRMTRQLHSRTHKELLLSSDSASSKFIGSTVNKWCGQKKARKLVAGI